MITAMVRAKLAATGGIISLVSDRVYVDMMPEPATLPGITIHPVSRIPDKEVGKGWVSRVQVSCWSDPIRAGGMRSPVEIENLAAEVTAALHKPALSDTRVERWTLGAVSYDITSRVVTGGTRVIEDPTGWYHCPLDVQITYREV